MDGHKITTAEIEKGMVKMKSGKATGSDGIEFELINALGDSESWLHLGGCS